MILRTLLAGGPSKLLRWSSPPWHRQLRKVRSRQHLTCVQLHRWTIRCWKSRQCLARIGWFLKQWGSRMSILHHRNRGRVQNLIISSILHQEVAIRGNHGWKVLGRLYRIAARWRPWFGRDQIPKRIGIIFNHTILRHSLRNLWRKIRIIRVWWMWRRQAWGHHWTFIKKNNLIRILDPKLKKKII